MGFCLKLKKQTLLDAKIYQILRCLLLQNFGLSQPYPYHVKFGIKVDFTINRPFLREKKM